MRLYIHIFGSEELLGSIDRQILNFVDPFLPCIVSFSWISLRVFVGKNRAVGLQNRGRNVVLTRNEFELVSLAILLSDKITIGLCILIEDVWCCLIHDEKSRKIEIYFSFLNNETVWI